MPWDPLAALSDDQRARLAAFERLLVQMNRRVNLVSPDTTGDVRRRHTRHGLALTHRAFPAGATVVDWGTGGGLPALPLAIACPHLTVVGVDSVGKKARAVRTMARRLGLPNVFAWHGRAEDWRGLDGAGDTRATLAVSRATAPLAALWRWTRAACVPGPPTTAAAGGDDAEGSAVVGDAATWPVGGLVCLKGGDLTGEIAALHAEAPDVRVEQIPLRPLLGDAYFAEKCIVAVHPHAA
jgi:16S rRNA (guanine527-N7)-methyltransferase